MWNLNGLFILNNKFDTDVKVEVCEKMKIYSSLSFSVVRKILLRSSSVLLSSTSTYVFSIFPPIYTTYNDQNRFIGKLENWPVLNIKLWHFRPFKLYTRITYCAHHEQLADSPVQPRKSKLLKNIFFPSTIPSEIVLCLVQCCNKGV